MDERVTDRLQKVLEGFAAEIAVAGDFMLDEYVWGTVNRISPESPVPVVEYLGQSSALGGAGNVVMNVKALGGIPAPLGILGDDEAGRKVREALEREAGVRAEFLYTDAARPTTVKRRIIAHHQQLLRIDSESRDPLSADLEQRLVEALEIAAARSKAVIVSDYGKGVVTRSFFDQAVQICVRLGIPLILDPKAFDLTGVGPVTVITPNEREAERFSRQRIHGDQDLEEAGRRLLELTGAQHILITRGEHGMSLFAANGAVIHIPAQARDVFDVTGAGDTVVATLALALAAGADMREAAEVANLAAGIVVGKVGTATVSRAELEAALNGEWPRFPEPSRRAR